MPEAQYRSELYLLLATLLREPPREDLLAELKARQGGWTTGCKRLEEELVELSRAAGECNPEELLREYHRLFIGVTQGLLFPYESWYKAGCLHDRSLAELRGELAALGVERTPGVGEPEDHIAALCEVMALLIEDHDQRQGAFFNRHLAPWVGSFCVDLQEVTTARYFRAVGGLSQQWFTLEQRLMN